MSTDQHRELITEILSDDELLSTIDAEVDEITDDSLLLVVPYSSLISLADSTPGMGETVHAGIVATMVDMAGEVLRLAADDPETMVLATTDLHVTYLRPATDDLHVTAEIRRAGESMATSTVSVESDDPEGRRKEVATGSASYRVLTDRS